MLRMLLPSPAFPQRQRQRHRTGIRFLVLLLLALLAVDNKCTELDYGDEDDRSSSSSSSSPSSPGSKTFSNTQSIIELVGPKKYVALGGNDLIISYRLSPSLASSPTSTTLSPSPSTTSLHSSRHGVRSTNPQPWLASSSGGPITAGRRKLIMYLTLEDEGIGERLGDESETLITKQVLTQPPVTAWHEVHFDCGWIVHGANYKVTLMEELEPQSHRSNRTRIFIASLTIHADYPSIDFEVPHRLESYTASVPISIGLTRTLCKPKLPLPVTQLTLNLCKLDSDDSGSDDRSKDSSNYPEHEHEDCGRVFAVLASNPLDQLQKEGQITMTVGCSLWGRSGHFRVQLGRFFSTRLEGAKHKANNTWIARSEPIKVDWSSRFRVGFTKNRKSIISCPETESVELEIDYPSCVINGLDKIRVYGYETLPLPSMLAPKRLSYIREELIPSNTHHLSFSCSLFPQRFPRYCFQYINTAVDGSVAVVVEECIPTLPPDQFSDGGWGPWSAWSSCSTSCGREGRRFRYRFCDSPLPSFGANYCQGDSIEESECDTLPDCAPPKRKPFDISSIYEDNEYLDPDGSSGEAGERQANTTPPFLHINNLNYTSGCECGCLLHDLVPGFNYSLIVTLSPSQSYCEDEDEEEHHNLKWILHAKGDGNRIRFLIVGVDLQCITLSFRDGNTTDSNLLEVMTMSTQYSLLQPSTAAKQEQASGNDMDNRNIAAAADGKEKEESRRLKKLLHIIESTGASLSIATSESTRNCSATPTVYFVAYYHIVPSSPHSNHSSARAAAAAAGTGIAERHSKEWNLYEFWSFLVIKFVLTFFVIIILFTTFGGFATKMYRRAKYKKLTWIVTDDEKMNGSQSETDSDEDEESNCRGRRRHRGQGEDGEEYDQLMSNGSRNTSVTLMSFDQSYWKQLRTMRLKHFLLAPRRKHVLTKVKSYPSTPVHGKQIKLAFRTKAFAGEANRGDRFDDDRRCGSGDGAGDSDNYDKNGQDILSSKTSNDSHLEKSESRFVWRHKKELNRLTSLSDSNLKNMKRVNLRDIMRDEWDEEEIEFERRRIVQCYRSRRSGGSSSSRPSSIIIVRSKSSNVPIMAHALRTLPTCNKKLGVAESQNTGVDLCLDTCGCGSGKGGDRLRNNKCNCSCTTRFVNDINTRARRSKRMDEEESGEEETKGKRRAVLAIMKRSVRQEENEKKRKEKENLKRRGIEMSQIMSKEQCVYARVHQYESARAKLEYETGKTLDSRSGTPATTTSASSGGTCSLSGKSRKSKHKIRVQQGCFESESSIPYSIKNSSGYLCSVRQGESRDTDLNDMDDDDEQDFEMDYYDYDASNAANIPGSLFGMEPAFVLWNSEMFSQDQSGGDGEDRIMGSQTTDELPRTMSSNTNTNYDNDGFCCGVDTMTDNGEEDEEMLELITTTTDSNLSSGSTAAPAPVNTAVYFRRNSPSIELLELQQSRNKQQPQSKMPKVREISLDTLKYVDDAEFDDDV